MTIIKSKSKYGTVLVNPPWFARGDNPDDTERKLRTLPLFNWLAEDCVIALWHPPEHANRIQGIVDSWAMSYTTTIPWIAVEGKLHRSPLPVKGTIRFLAIARRGYMPPPEDALANLIALSADSGPSCGLDQVYGILERSCPPPYLELFALRNRPNWDAWGDPNTIASIDLFEGLPKDYAYDKVVESSLERIRHLWVAYKVARWEIGDITKQLLKTYSPTITKDKLLKMVAAQLVNAGGGEGTRFIAELVNIAETFGPKERDLRIGFSKYRRQYRHMRSLPQQRKRIAERRTMRHEVEEWVDEVFGFVDRRGESDT